MRVHLLILCILCSFLSGCVYRPPSYRIAIPATLPHAKPLDSVGVAVVLGGGGARGAAHIGVLSVLEREGVPIHLLVGSSAGALVGGLYADSKNIRTVYREMKALDKWDILEPTLDHFVGFMVTKSALMNGQRFVSRLEQMLKADRFEALHIPMIAVSSDLKHYQAVAIRSGPLVPALYASAAIPMIFSPVPLYGMELVDGGVTDPVPVRFAKEHHPKLTIAVDISILDGCTDLHNPWCTGYAAMYLSYYEMSRLSAQGADVIIHPNLTGIGMFDGEMFDVAYQRGVVAAENAMPRIRAKLEADRIPLKRSPPPITWNKP